MASNHEIRQRVTNEIIEALESRGCPWHMPWSPSRNTGFPTNVITRRRYSGVNPLLLQIAALERGFHSKWWGNVEEWASLGGQVKGCGTAIVLREINGERHAATMPLLREHVVFSADQVEGVEQYQPQAPKVDVQPDFEPAERVIAATGADIREVDAGKAWYFYPPNDYIELPPRSSFIFGIGGVKGWYDTAFHELCHWSEPRLGWNGGYALNEMRAEMGAGFIAAAIGIPSYGPTNHHFNHVDAWVAALRDDHRTIFRVSRAASAVVKFLLSFSRAEQSQDREEVSA